MDGVGEVRVVDLHRGNIDRDRQAAGSRSRPRDTPSRSTHSPIARMVPESSAIGMNSVGEIVPARRVLPPQQGLETRRPGRLRCPSAAGRRAATRRARSHCADRARAGGGRGPRRPSPPRKTDRFPGLRSWHDRARCRRGRAGHADRWRRRDRWRCRCCVEIGASVSGGLARAFAGPPGWSRRPGRPRPGWKGREE